MPSNTTHSESSAVADRRSARRFDLAAVVFLVAGVSAIYGARLTLEPLVGEETRWATGAREMLATGDWIVPRQQGHIFPERPPMTMWAMAAVGWLRGDVDPIAVRLPSVVAVVLTVLLIYGYLRSFASIVAAVVAALAYATMGQVLQIGRFGESEAFFALLVSASLL
ncbi:MAG TPA: glycosyltransferase family 39 protein, partial [Lacipirellulaceae bacterium]|nr:glycosyltransferase family 39 protein [Lacipirellulaceae bacterium]